MSDREDVTEELNTNYRQNGELQRLQKNLRQPEDQPESEKKIHIRNLTAKRIGIEQKNAAKKKSEDSTSQDRKNGDLDLFVLPPFGERTLKSNELDKLEHEPWEQLNLVKMESEEKKESFVSIIAFVILFWSFIIGGPLMLLGFSLPYFWPIITILLVIGLSQIGWVRGKLSNVWKVAHEWGGRSLSMLAILTIGFGLPILVIYLWGGLSLTNSQPLELLFRLLQLIFIGTASILPALMYFLFTSRKLETLQESFFREIVQLDPRVISVDDAKSLYGNKIEAVYGSPKEFSRQVLYEVRSPILIATLVLTVGWIFTLRPWEPVHQDDFFSPNRTAIVFGFLGAYFFGLNMLFRRYTRSDLRPKTYTHITVRILTVIILAWVLSEVPTINDSWALLPLAFIVGIFPETGIAIILESLRNIGPLRKVIGLSENEKSLQELDGINLYHRAQLLEEGIENIENLAHHDLIDLLLQTRIPAPRLVDWVDQAILHLHVKQLTDMGGPKSGKTSKNPLCLDEALCEHGIRTATDLKRACDAARIRGEVDELLIKLDGKPDSDAKAKAKRFQVILDTLEDDEWMPYILHWRDTEKFTNRIFTIDELRGILYSGAQKEKPVRLDAAILVAPPSENSQLSPIPPA